MVRGFWTGTAAGLVLAVTGLSMCMNFAFGYGLGTSEGTGQMLGALSVAFDGLKALLPLFIAWQWRDRRWVRAGAGGVLFVLVAAYGMASALGFSSQNREDVTASREHLNASLKEHLGDLELAERRLKALGPHRIAGAVEADIARLKKDRPWDATSGCTDATLAASREFCKRIDTLRAELALAAEDHVLTSKIEGLKFKVQQLRARGAGREADPQLGEIARAAGLDILRVRSGMNWLLAIAVEAVSCFGLFAIAGARAPRAAVMQAEEPAGSGKPWRLVNPKEVRSAATLLHAPVRKPKRSAARKTEQRKGNGAVPKALPRPRAGERPQTET
ncbi:MAG: hypothetical protein WAN86_15470 [Hyphomicrobiaceae bacterium]